jgi:hypothetical protein
MHHRNSGKHTRRGVPQDARPLAAGPFVGLGRVGSIG